MAMKYFTSLDGLRGIAIYLVFLFHGAFASGGFIGVDIFFTLSGFLITSLLFSEYEENGGIDLLRFYWRRALRLVSALLFLLIISWLAGYGPYRLNILFAVVFYYANIYRAVVGEDHMGVVEHTWSLSIEEQFYLQRLALE